MTLWHTCLKKIGSHMHANCVNSKRMIVHVFFALNNSRTASYVFEEEEFKDGPFSEWDQTRLKDYGLRRFFSNKNGEQLPHGVHVRYYDQRGTNFTVDQEWISHLNTYAGSLERSFTLTQALEKRSNLYMNQFDGLSRCMKDVETYEKFSGNQFDIVARIRDDAYAMDDWILDTSYLQHEGITT